MKLIYDKVQVFKWNGEQLRGVVDEEGNPVEPGTGILLFNDDGSPKLGPGDPVLDGEGNPTYAYRIVGQAKDKFDVDDEAAEGLGAIRSAEKLPLEKDPTQIPRHAYYGELVEVDVDPQTAVELRAAGADLYTTFPSDHITDAQRLRIARSIRARVIGKFDHVFGGHPPGKVGGVAIAAQQINDLKSFVTKLRDMPENYPDGNVPADFWTELGKDWSKD